MTKIALSYLATTDYYTFYLEFLAAMSSSRSDGVTHCVRPSVRDQGVFCSLKTIFRVMKDSRVFHKSFKDVLRKFQGCFKKNSRMF